MSPYLTFSRYLSTIFPGGVRKVAVNAGLGCPNRCTYCNNAAFSPAYAKRDAVHPERFSLLTPQRYAQIILSMLDRLRPDIALDRFVSEAPPDMVLAPSWGLKPAQFADLLEKMGVAG